MAKQLEHICITEGGRLDRTGSLYLLTVEGNREELGTAHAELTRYISGDTPAQYYRSLLSNLIRETLLGTTAAMRAGITARILYRIAGCRNRTLVRGGLLEETRALIAGLKIPARRAKQLLLFPDILHYLAGKRGAAGPGCSAAFVSPERAAGGQSLLARNFDFFGVGVWNEYQAVKRFFPDEGMPYLWVGPLGIPVGGFGLNKAGMAVMPFTLFNSDCGLKGTPMFRLMDSLLRETDSLASAESLITDTPLTGSYSLLVADMGKGSAKAFGIGRKGKTVVAPADGILLRTNHVVAEPLLRTDSTPPAWKHNSMARYGRMNEVLNSGHKPVTREMLLGLLADDRDPLEDRESLAGGVLPAANNALSLVLDWKKKELIIAGGNYPVARSPVRERFSVRELFSPGKDPWKGTLHIKHRTAPSRQEAAHLYSAAWHALFDLHDQAQALRLLRDAGALAPKEPAFPRVSGLLHLRSGDWEWAVRNLERAFDLEPTGAGRKASTGLWLARALDCAGARERAVDLYDRLIEMDPEGPSGRAAMKGVRRPFPRNRAHRMRVDFVTASAV